MFLLTLGIRTIETRLGKTARTSGEMLKVDAVLDEFEQVHPHQPGIVLSPPKQIAAVDLRHAFQAIRWLGRRTVTCRSVSMVDEHPPM
jgi:hypothetical protein